MQHGLHDSGGGCVLQESRCSITPPCLLLLMMILLLFFLLLLHLLACDLL
jgi:hypothetical protein